MPKNAFRFNLQELGGALGDLGTLLPLMVALILLNGLNVTAVLVLVGLFYISSGLYYRVPTPVQPLKAVAAIAISLGLSASVISAAGLLMGMILLVLSATGLIRQVVKLFPRAVVRGIQFSIGLILFRKGVEFALGRQMFISEASGSFAAVPLPIGLMLALSALFIFVLFKFVLFQKSHHFPPSLALLGFGLGAGFTFGPSLVPDRMGIALPGITLPTAADFWIAFTVLVIPQLPLTLGNAVVSTSDAARVYFGKNGKRLTPKALAFSMGIANLSAGLAGGMPMCHGSGGLTAHYKLGARTGGASLMVGGLILAAGLLLGRAAVPYLSVVPLPVLGVLLAVVGIYHALLVRDLAGWRQVVVAGAVAVAALSLGNLAFGFAAGILLYHVTKMNLPGRAEAAEAGAGK